MFPNFQSTTLESLHLNTKQWNITYRGWRWNRATFCSIRLPAAAVILRDVNCDFSNYLWKSWNFRSNIPNMSKLSDRCHWKYWSVGANRRLVQSLSILYLNFQIVFGYLKIIFQIIITKCIFLLIYHIDIVNRNLHIFSNFLVTYKAGVLGYKAGELRV